MEIHIERRGLRHLFVLVVLLGLSGGRGAGATPVVVLPFEDASGAFDTTGATLAPGIGGLTFTDRAGTLAAVAGNPGRAAAARGWLGGNAFELALTLLPGVTLSPRTLAFDERASGTGPRRFMVLLNGRAVAGGDTSARFASHVMALPESAIAGLVRIAIEATGAASERGTWRIDNLSLAGAITRPRAVAAVPQPATLPLLLVALAPLALLRQRASARAASSQRRAQA